MECFQPEGMKFESDVRRKGQGSQRTKNKFSLFSRTNFSWRNSEILVCFLLNKSIMCFPMCLCDVLPYMEKSRLKGAL